jgi:hypothetical protein
MEEKGLSKTDRGKTSSVDIELDLGLEKRLIGIKEFPIYNSNPFVKDMIKIKDKSRNRIISVTKSPIGYTGNMEEGQQQAIFAHTQKKVDGGEFIKIFTQHIREWFGLTKPALRVFYYLL